jgi:hypothetical protein
MRGTPLGVRLSTVFGDVLILRHEEARSEEHREAIRPAVVRLEIERWLCDRATRRTLFALCGVPGSTTDALARKRVEEAFIRGRLVVVRNARPVSVERPADREELEVLGPEPEKPSFVEVLALDAKGKPLAGEPYKITLASGEVKRGKTDGNGLVRIDDVLGDDFLIEFPDRAPKEAPARSSAKAS